MSDIFQTDQYILRDNPALNQGGGGGAIGTELDSLSDSTTAITDNDKIVSRENANSTWYKKTFSKVWDYIKTKLGISAQGSTSKFLNEKGSFVTPYSVMTANELKTGTATDERTMRADYAKDGIKQIMLECCYPVGSFYISTKNVSPATFLGGTWAARSGYMLRGATSSVTFNSNNNDGGADSVTVSSVASHNHTQNSHDHKTIDGGTALFYNPTSENQFEYVWGNSWKRPQSVSGTNTGSKTATNISNGANYTVNTLPKYKNVYMWERTA